MATWSEPSASKVFTLSGDGRVSLRKVKSADAADDAAIRITLFRTANRGACGWYIGPLALKGGKIAIPYLPKSKRTMASVAVVLGLRAAECTGAPVCLIDPDDLWTQAWRS